MCKFKRFDSHKHNNNLKNTATCLKAMSICKPKYNIDLLMQVFPQNVVCRTKNKTFIRLTMKQKCVKILYRRVDYKK